MNSEIEKLKTKLRRKINAYAAAKAADLGCGTQDTAVELQLQEKQLDELIDHVFERLTPIDLGAENGAR